MKKKALKSAATGFLIGCFACLLFSVLVSLRVNTGEFCFALPALAKAYGSELLGALVQIGVFSWLGAACGIASLFSESVGLGSAKQGAGYLVSLTLGMLPLAWAGRWHEHIFIGIFSYVVIAAIVSLLIHVVGLVRLKSDVDEIRKAIGLGREVSNEEK